MYDAQRPFEAVDPCEILLSYLFVCFSAVGAGKGFISV